MASATATAKPERKRRSYRSRWLPGSRLGRLIIALNLLGLTILIVGALVLNELRRGLVIARIDSLTTQGELMATVIDQAATVGEPAPGMDPTYASQLLLQLASRKTQRARLFDTNGKVIADSDWVADRVEARELAPARPRGARQGFHLDFAFNPFRHSAEEGRRARMREVATALQGQRVAELRRGEEGQRVVSVSIPIQHVRAVLGVLTLEASDVDEIIAKERLALIPSILISITVTLLSSLLLNTLIAQPVLQLARAADRVRLAGARAISLPALAERDDELGDLTRSLEAMTQSLSERMDAIESFAADVAHEIRNPLTSLRSAIETLDLVSDPAARERLFRILKNDIQRLDRLVTDISNASRLDAELSRDQPKILDLDRLIADIVLTYEARVRAGEPTVRYQRPAAPGPVLVRGREGPLGQIVRNLVDNARSFSPPGEEVLVGLFRVRDRIMVTVTDKGPGIPPENLETIFQRFYTSRPKGQAFGGNSGLGLSIARQIAEAHGGTLVAKNLVSEGGQVLGAMFVLTLPEARP